MSAGVAREISGHPGEEHKSVCEFLRSSRWNPLTTSGAGCYLYAVIVALWGSSVLLRWDRVL